MRKISKISLVEKKYANIFFIVFMLIMTTAVVVVFLQIRTVFENLIVRETQKRELAIGISQCEVIDSFIKGITTNIFIFSKTKAVIENDHKSTEELFNSYLAEAPFPVNGLSRLDEKGIARVYVDREKILDGRNQNFSDREYFKYTKEPENKNKIYISSAFKSRAGSSKDKFVFVTAVPIYDGNNFKGTIVLATRIDRFGKQLLTMGKVGKHMKSFLISKNGQIVAANIVDEEELKIWSRNIIREKPELDAKITGLTYVFPISIESSNEFVYSYKTIASNDLDLKLLVAHPKDRIIEDYWNINLPLFISILLVSLVGIVIGSIITIAIARAAWKEGYLKGLKKKID